MLNIKKKQINERKKRLSFALVGKDGKDDCGARLGGFAPKSSKLIKFSF